MNIYLYAIGIVLLVGAFYYAALKARDAYQKRKDRRACSSCGNPSCERVYLRMKKEDKPLKTDTFFDFREVERILFGDVMFVETHKICHEQNCPKKDVAVVVKPIEEKRFGRFKLWLNQDKCKPNATLKDFIGDWAKNEVARLEGIQKRKDEKKRQKGNFLFEPPPLRKADVPSVPPDSRLSKLF